MNKISRKLKVLAFIPADGANCSTACWRSCSDEPNRTAEMQLWASQSGRTPAEILSMKIKNSIGQRGQPWYSLTSTEKVLDFGPRELYLWLYTDLMAHSSRGPILLQYRCLQGRKLVYKAHADRMCTVPPGSKFGQLAGGSLPASWNKLCLGNWAE